MQVITIAIQKGGTGKSTTAAALAQAAIRDGKNVLLIDMDPQGNLSYTVGADTRRKGAFDLLQGTPARETIQTTKTGNDIIAAQFQLSAITTGAGAARKLQKAIDGIRNEYDIIIIDTPPTAGILQYNALQASNSLIIPIQAEIYSLQSLYLISDTARSIRKTNAELQVKGIVFTRHTDRANIKKKMANLIIEKAAALNIPYLGAVREGVAVQEAAATQQNIFEYAPKSKPAADYLALYHAIFD